MFRFKQFSVDQSNCAMKINTDGVLLGALVEMNNPKSILDIGTGTGVIALMLAQKYNNAVIDAVEIDKDASETAQHNFNNSIFKKQLRVYQTNIKLFFKADPPKKYDLIISNPPFYINSLLSPAEKKSLAKHADLLFFETLLQNIPSHLSANGCFWLILPVEVAQITRELALQNRLYCIKLIKIKSFKDSEVHREIICFGLEEVFFDTEDFIIYDSIGVYSEGYRTILQPYFLAF